MSKIKTSISLDERLVSDLDRQAKADGVSRSELIERLCRRSLSEEPKVEIIHFNGPPTAIVPALSMLSWHDEDGPVELIIKAPKERWEEWSQKTQNLAARNRAVKESE